MSSPITTVSLISEGETPWSFAATPDETSGNWATEREATEEVLPEGCTATASWLRPWNPETRKHEVLGATEQHLYLAISAA